MSLVAGVPLSALISDAIGWRATYGVLALRRRRPAAPVCPNARCHPAPLRLSRLLAPLSYRDVPALLLAAWRSRPPGVYAFLADHVRRLLALSAGQVGFHRLRLRRRLHAVGLLGARLIERLGRAACRWRWAPPR